jgi:hypothetical protein
MKQINEQFYRMQQLAGLITEIKVEMPLPGTWKETDTWNNSEEEMDSFGGKMVMAFESPMEGWDKENMDAVYIIKKPNNTYDVNGYISFGNFDPVIGLTSLQAAKSKAIEIMTELSVDNDENYDDDYGDDNL